MIEYSKEDIDNLARLFTEFFTVQNYHEVTAIYFVTGSVVCIEDLDEVKKFVNLDKMSSEVLGITDPIGQLAKWLADKFKWLVDTLSNVFKSIIQDFVSFVQELINGVSFLINQLWSWLTDAFNTLESFISSLINGIYTTLTNIWNGIVQFFTNLASTIQTLFNQLVNALQGFAQQILSAITNAFNVVVTNIENAFNILRQLITSAFSTVVNYVSKIPEVVTSAIKSFVNVVVSYFDQVLKSITYIANLISNVFRQIGTIIWNAVQSAFNAVRNAIEAVINAISNIGKSIAEFFTRIYQGITWLGSQITSLFADIANKIRAGFTLIANALTGFVNAILKFPEWFPKWFYENIAKPIVDGLNALAKFIWDHLPEPIKVAFEKIRDFFVTTWNFFTVTLPNFFGELYKGLVNFISNPIEWFKKNVIEPIWIGLVALGKEFVNAITVFGQVLFNVFKEIGNFFINVGKAICEALFTIINDIANAFKAIFNIFLAPLRDTFHNLILNMSMKLREIAQQRKVEVGELFVFDPFALLILESMFLPYAYGTTIEMLADFIPRPRIKLSPLNVGVGVEIKVDDAVKKTGSFLKELGKEFARGYIIGFGMAFGEVLLEGIRHYIALALRNIVPIEIPSLTEGKHLVQRAMPTGKFSEVLSKFREWLELRGYADYIIDLFASTPDKWSTEILDRFGRKRLVPLAEIYEIPTVSELCRMMMKDMFASFDDFVKIMSARGVYRDIAYLFYLLHFKYPSPETLWKFACRAIAGETWFRPTETIRKEAEKEAQAVGAYVPEVAPADLANALKNPDTAKLVFNALSTYMKWHDYARFAWIKGFTCDNWIVIDVLPEIPSKIDLRWMVRWGLFEAWSAWGIGLTTTIEEITTNYLNKTAEPVYRYLLEQLKSQKVVMDVRQFCRMLQADKQHPYWVPWIAIAETINALTEERTLIRTGFWNLYKEGLFNKDLMDTMFAGFFTVQFKVGYFDINTYTWKEGTVEIPIMYLPAEAKLIEIRCVMDRAVDIFRDLQREVMYAIREAIFTPQQAIDILVGFVEDEGKLTKLCKELGILVPNNFRAFSRWFADEIYNITGKQGAKLTVDSNWIMYYSMVYNIASYREMINRLRYWLARIVAWSIYRLAYGYVTREDLERILSVVKEKAKLMDYEVDAIRTIADILIGIAKREYIPTPYMLATLAEYVPEVRRLVDEVLKKRGVPPEWIPIWKKLIEVRPLIDDIRRFITRLITVYSYGILDTKQLKDTFTKLTEFGFEQNEIEFNVKTAELYRIQRIFTQIIPSPIGLTTYYRYVPEALQLLEEKLAKILEPELVRKYLPKLDIKKLIEFYKKLAINRSVYVDVRGYIHDLIRAYEYGKIDDKTLEAELRSLMVYGLNEENIKLIIKRAKLRRMIRMPQV